MSGVKKENRSSVFVLGMHRSGTSAIAPGIKALGFDLGDNLMPAKPDNVKGFWEDWDVVKLNEQILSSDTGTWDRLSLFDPNQLSQEKLESHISKAAELIRKKFSHVTKFAIKDPRISLTLPIWREACKREHIKPYHILCLRHPLSVALSLAARNSLPKSNALLLWLNHVYCVLRNCHAPLLVVGYENFLSNPYEELCRIAVFLDVGSDSDTTSSPAVFDFLDQCLDGNLDHSRVDGLKSCEWLSLVDLFYQALSQHQASTPIPRNQQTRLLEQFQLDDKLIIELNNSGASHRNLKLLQNSFDAVVDENSSLISSLTEINHRLPHLNTAEVKAVVELNQLRDELEAVKADRAKVDADRQHIDVERSKLIDVNRTIAEDKQHLVESHRVSAQRIEQLEKELSAAREYSERLSTLNSELNENNSSLQKKINAADSNLQVKAGELSDAQKQQGDLLAEIAEYKRLQGSMADDLRELRLIRVSRIWRMTAPFRRIIGGLYEVPGLRNILQRRTLALQPMNQLELRPENSWASIGQDPQFLLLNIRCPVRPGSYEVKLFISEGEQLLTPSLYIDYGAGFREENSVQFTVTGQTAQALVTLTDPAYQIRLDPCERPGSFVINRAVWRPVSRLETLIRLTRHVIRKNRARGFTLGETFKGGIRKARQVGWRNIWGNADQYFTPDHQLEQEGLSYERWMEAYEYPYRMVRYGEANTPALELIFPVILVDCRQDLDATRRTLESLTPQCEIFGPVLVLSAQKYPEALPQQLSVQNCHEPGRHVAAATEFAQNHSNRHMVVVSTGNVVDAFLGQALVAQLAKNPNSRLIYTDNDSLSEGTQRDNPEFKPAWNPDFELAAHYIGDTFCISGELLNQISFRWLDYGQNALYALLTAAIPLIRDDSVAHIPEVLWHKTGAPRKIAELGQIQEILSGLIFPLSAGVIKERGNSRGYRLQYRLPKKEPTVEIIIPTKDQSRLLRVCIDSILEKTRYDNYRIVVVDNGSAERSTLDYFDELSRIERCNILPYPHPFNYSAINNYAVDQSSSDVVVLLNNDIEVISPDWLQELVSHAIRPEIGCVGAKLYYPDNRIQHAGVVLGIHGIAGHVFRLSDRDAQGSLERLRYIQNYSAVTGACLAVRRSLYLETGGLNDQDLPIAFNDIDFCLKVQEAGYRNLWTPYAELYHHESATRGEYDDSEKLKGLRQEAGYMAQRWGELIVSDPAYNPNLSLSGTDFELSARYVGGVLPKNTDASFSISEHPYRAEMNITRVNQVLRLSKIPVPREQEYKPGLSVVILTLEKPELIEPLLESLVSARARLSKTDGIDLQIIVGDTGSQDKAVHALYRRLAGKVTVVNGMKYHFSRCNNQLFKDYVAHETVLFLNNDIIFSDPAHSLSAMHSLLINNDDIAIVGTYLLYPNKRLQHGGVDMFDKGDLRGLCYHPGHNTDFQLPNDGEVRDIPAVTGACLMMKSAGFAGCNFFDESYEAEAQDVDLCLKARRIGQSVKLICCGEVVHLENATRPRGDANQRDRSRFIRKWKTYQEAIGLE